MKTAFQVLILALLILAATGCSYSDPDIYYVEPIVANPASVLVLTNLDSIDTAPVADSLLLRYRAEIEGGEMYATQATIESQAIYLRYTPYNPDTISGSFIVSDSFWIRQDQLADTGVSTLGFNVYYSANTNSLADIVGLEAEILELEFKLSQEGAQK